MNRTLARQLRRLGLEPDHPPEDPETWRRFLDRVATFYEEADRGRYLLERAMDVSSREMSEMNRAIEALSSARVERSEQHYRTLFHQLPVGAIEEDFTKAVAYLDGLRADGVTGLAAHFQEHPTELDTCIGLVDVVDGNRALADLLRVPHREMLVGPLDPTGLSESARDAWQRQFVAISQGERRIVVDFTGRRFDGSEFAANLHWTAAEYDGVLEYGRVIVVLIDITERKETEQRMRDLVRSKDEFLASVSHELRTPLTSVVGFADLLRRDGVAAEEREGILATIADQAADLSDIVEDLLVGARVELGELGVGAEVLDVMEQIERLRTAGGSILPAVEVVEAPQGPVQAMGDAARVRQILRNLLSNAARYGGPRVTVRVAREGSRVVVAVCDDGPALAPEVAGRIFDRYYRQASGGAQPGSVGIGLTISRDLARRMGGDLAYHHDGVWSVFELVLMAPAAKRAA
ncbi:MAG TPA: HAMP domain-containing sensor histidine kinase [Acidimicrobiia bacterium]|nr:HAMP domain-containing sensor histidine kinase [Acidimicrobiia bacterium]